MFLGATPRSNEPYDITQDRFKLNADYRGPGSLRTSVGIEQDNRQRNYQEVVTTRETTLWGRVSAQPLENLSLTASSRMPTAAIRPTASRRGSTARRTRCCASSTSPTGCATAPACAPTTPSTSR